MNVAVKVVWRSADRRFGWATVTTGLGDVPMIVAGRRYDLRSRQYRTFMVFLGDTKPSSFESEITFEQLPTVLLAVALETQKAIAFQDETLVKSAGNEGGESV